MAIKNEEWWIYNEQEIAKYFLENFKELYHSNHPSLAPDLEEMGEKVITDAENERIYEIPSEEEIKDAV